MEFRGGIKRIDATTRYEQDGTPYQVVRVTFESKMSAERLSKLQRWADSELIDIELTLPSQRVG